jgi:hypothetical protein
MMLDVYQSSGDSDFPEYLVDPGDPFNPEAGKSMQSNFDTFWEKAVEWTEKYGKK